MIRRTVTLLASSTLLSLLVATAPAQAQLGILDDFGDAPVSFGEASHALLNADIPVYMGDTLVGFDPDAGNQPSARADADDCHLPLGGVIPPEIEDPLLQYCDPSPLALLTPLLSDTNNFLLDDEDGVDIGSLIPGQTTPVSVSTTAPGFLDAWIDWSGDGNFTTPAGGIDPGEQIFSNQALTAGENALQFTVPATTSVGVTYARFRFASNAADVTGPTGAAPNGEVEDYEIAIAQDFGDAPDSYDTLLDDGARHSIVSNLKLGAITDSEPNGIPSTQAVGDDANPVGGPDDEDGVVFGGPFVQGESTPVTVTVTSSGPAKLDAFADFDHDGNFTDAGEKIVDDVAVNNGPNAISVAVPAAAVTGNTFTRWRLSTVGDLPHNGSAPNGEVEDHLVVTTAAAQLDFGDAPDAPAPNEEYPTLEDNNGARHPIGGALHLGDAIDDEPDGQPTPAADGDDADGLDDEDGVDFTDTVLVPGKATTVNVESSGGGLLDGWVDANFDGDWEDDGEHVIDSAPVSACGDLDNNVCTGSQDVGFTMPPGSNFGSGPDGTFFRFRLSSGGTNAPEGFVPDGEVEDYLVDVVLECGAVVTGNFVLPFDLNCPPSGPVIDPDQINGLFVGDSETDIDLNGHTISGLEPAIDGSVGIGVWAGITTPNGKAQDVTIHDGFIESFDIGIDWFGDRLTVSNVDILRSAGDGLVVEGIDALFENGAILDNSNGITNDGHGLSVVNSDVSQNREAGIVNEGADLVVENTTVTENGDDGVRSQGQDGTVRGSTVSRNTQSGIEITGTNGLVTGSTVEDNGGDGASLDGDRGRVNDNVSISKNGGDGVRMIGNLDNVQVLRNAQINDNGGDGIHVLSGRKIFVKLNTAKFNGDDGIDIEKNARGRVNVNTLGRGNHDFAIEAHDRVTGTKNKGFPCRPAKLCSDA